MEKAILADLPSEVGTANQEGSPGIPEEATVPSIVSAWDCVVTISPNQPPLTEQAEADRTLQGSDSSSGLAATPSSSKMLSAESQRKLAVGEELRVRNEEQRANLEGYSSQTTRHIQIKPLGLHRDVLAETIHLCLDVYTRSSYKTIPALIECGVDIFPDQLKEERNRRREVTNLIDRVMWMKASKEIELGDDALAKLLSMLQKVR